MKFLSYIAAVTFLAIPMFCHADWMSEIDKKYQRRLPSQYAKVSKAKDLITHANGNTDQIYKAVDLLTSVTKEDKTFAPAYVQLARAASNLGILPNNNFDPDA